MLKKIIKYDLRALFKTILPMMIFIIVTSGICGIGLLAAILLGRVENETVIIIANLAIFGIASVYPMVVYGIFAGLVIVAAFRYYKSVFTDEGYLTMVIPEDSANIFKAKLFSSLIAIGVSSAVIFLSAIVAMGLPPLICYANNVFETLKYYIPILVKSPNFYVSLIFLPIISVLSFINSVLVCLTSVTVGSLLVSKHKGISSIITYFVLSYIESSVVSAVGVVASVAVILTENFTLVADLTMIFASGIYCLTIAALYFINCYLLKRKFNLQ